MLFPGDGSSEQLVRFSVSGIDAVVADHLEILFRDVLGQSCDEIEAGIVSVTSLLSSWRL